MAVEDGLLAAAPTDRVSIGHAPKKTRSKNTASPQWNKSTT